LPTLIHSQVWDAFEGEHLFTGRDPEHGTYRGRAHLAEMIALLGPPPPNLLARANFKSKFFSEEGKSSKTSSANWRPPDYRFTRLTMALLKGVFSAGIPIPCSTILEDRETSLQGEESKEDRELFLRFMRKMLQWEPGSRSSARELAEDEWILKHTT